MTTFKDPIYVTRPVLPDLNGLMQRMREVWGSQWLTNNGDQVQFLERELTRYLGVPALSLFNNGTIALIVALQRLRLKGEVITTPFTFPATPHVITWNGLAPVFCDIDPVTMNIDPARIEAAITPATSAILAVHVYGTPCNVEAIQAVADRHKLRLVYDAAHAFGVEIDGVGIGNFGDISMFSFHATKLFHSAEGGALAMRDPALKNEIDLLKNFGIRNENEVIMPGINGKMNEIQAVVGLAVLELVDEERKKRQTLAQTYRQRLGEVEGIRLLLPGSSISESMQYFVIRIDRNRFGRSRDEVHEAFRNHNVFTRKYFYPLCSEYACYSSLPSSSPANLPVAHTVVREVLCLPFYGGLTQDQVNDICDILLSLKR